VCLALLERSLTTFEAADDRWGVAAVLVARAKHAHVRADRTALASDATESARLFREVGDRWGLLQAIGWLGGHAEMIGDFEEAARLHTEGLHMAEGLGLWTEVAGEYGWLGWTAIRQGDYARAKVYGEHGLRLSTEQGHRSTQALAEIVLGFAARRTGELDVAEKRLQSLVDAARRQDEPVLYLSLVLEELGFTLELRGELDAARALHTEAFRIAHDVSSYSFTALARGARPLMAGRKGALLTLSYLGAVRSIPSYNVMGLAKASLEANVRFMAADLGPEGIRVNGISAGPIKTLAAAGIGGFSKILHFVEKNAPLRRGVSADEVAARVNAWKAMEVGMTLLRCRVTLDGEPLTNAKVVFEPEQFLGDEIKAAAGETNVYGDAGPVIPPEQRTDPKLPGGAHIGLYKVRISKIVNGKETIPARYNSETILGQEVSYDDPAIKNRNMSFALKSK